MVVDHGGTEDRRRASLSLELPTQLLEVEREGQVSGCPRGTLVSVRGIGSES
jgi:hypothetical protein